MAESPRQLKVLVFQYDPIIATGTGKIIQGAYRPISKGLIQKGVRIALSPTGVAGPVV